MLPTLFISHGAPTLAITETPAHHFLQKLGATLPRPQAIVVASAHWETSAPRVSAQTTNTTIHDFRGFPRALHEMHYTAPGDPVLAAQVVDLLNAAGFPAAPDSARGLDHGAWVPLSLMYPAADIPTLQISLQTARGPAYHLAMGQALAGLRAENVLVVGSGSFTHDLGRFHGQDITTPSPPDVTAFAAWADAAITAHRTEDLLAYRTLAPDAAANHPTEEHLLPLFVALGAAGADAKAKRLHASSEYGILRMDAYQFGSAI
jgi:4,5-DOPA dioxygenase extradiol